MRFAGTWKQYSKKAIPQLAMITFHSASLRNFRWPYHAKVIKMFEMVSNRIVRIRKGAPLLNCVNALERLRIDRSCILVKRLVPDSAQLYFRPLSHCRLPPLLFGNTRDRCSFAARGI